MYSNFDKNKSTQYDNYYRIILIGESGVGKSNIMMKYKYNTFEESFITTIGVDFVTKILDIRDKVIKLNIWDTAGQKKFRTITTSYYRSANAVCICYDITNKSTLDQLSEFVEQIKINSPPNVLIYIIGNKIDIQYHREVNKREIDEYCEKNGFKHIEISARSSVDLSNLFNTITFDLMKRDENTIPRIVSKKNLNKNVTCCKIC